MGLPSWAYGEQVPLTEWEDRGAYLYNRRTGERRPKGASGGRVNLKNLTSPDDYTPEELEAKKRAWAEESARRQAKGESQHANDERYAKIIEAMSGASADKEEAARIFRERLVMANRGAGDENFEDRTQEVTLPHGIDIILGKLGKDEYGRPLAGNGWLPRERIPYRYTKEYAERSRQATPQGWPHGWGETYDPRWRSPDGAIRPDAPEEVHRGIDESARLAELQDERELIDDEYEPTRSPLVLRKRHSNGTVTHVHALTGQPLFDLGEYGLNDPQGGSERDPYWRAGRREW